ncbi:MAG: ABC transporter ATP-binding protein [Dehalococcoidales bacterium]|nr:ABC transporter ATP-binding protein [Dehalococcoidales bacterium]
MDDVAIRVKNLSKRYRLGQTVGYKTLRDSLANALMSPFRRRRSATREPSATSTEPPGQSQEMSVKHRLDYIWALKDVSFEVKRGEAVGIIGENGSGKSTLLKILSRITSPTEGYAEIRGRVGSLLEVGTGFHPELTGRENIYLNGAILGLKKAEIQRKFGEIVAFSEIEKFLDTPVKRYSSGMYVRLAFAIAAHLEPDILLVDEVLAVGDAQFQKKCLGKMSDVTKEGRTVLFVSHNMGSVANLCQRALWLDAGQLVCVGNTHEIISSYIGSQQDTGAEIHWDNIEAAPGNEEVRLKSVRIKSNGIVTSHVPIDKEVVIEIDYLNLKDGNILDASIHLRDKTNSFVLASASWPSANLSVDKWFGKERPQGIYRSACVIPANFLNCDYYSIDIGITNQRHEWQIRQESVIAFLVHETGEMKKEYSGGWVGVVRPKLAWSTDYLGSKNTGE